MFFTQWRKWLRRGFDPAGRDRLRAAGRGPGRSRRSWRPRMEVLEDRLAPVVSIAPEAVTVAEGASVVLTVTRTDEPIDDDLTVSLAISGTATAGSDYTALPATLTIPAGADSATLTVTTLVDADSPEPDETIVVTLEPSPDYEIGTPDSSTVTISDVPPGALPTISITPATDTIAEGDSTTLTVTRTGDMTEPLVVAYAVTGTATSGSDFTPLSGTLTIPAGEDSATISVDALTDAVSPEPNEIVIITLTADPAYTIDPSGSGSIVTITDVPPAVATVTIAPATATVAEGAATTLTVTRTGPTDAALTVNLAVTGTATSGTDFAALPTTLTIPVGQSSATLTVTAFSDTVSPEPDETVIVTLTAGTGYEVGAAGASTVTITDAPAPAATVTVAPATATVAEGAATTLTVTRTGPTTAPLTVNFTVTGTATSGTDFAALPTSLTIPAGQASATLTVTAFNDTVSPEPNETVIVTLGPGAGYAVGAAGTSTVTITDAPAPATTVTIAPTTATVAEGAATTLTVTRTGATTAALTVNLAVTGTATSGTDFTALPTTLTIPAGQASATLSVAALTDAVSPEPNETVVVTLTPGTGYAVGAAGASTVTITDVPPAVATVTVAPATATVAEGAATTLTVSRTGPTTAPLTVNFTVTGTATSGTDFTALPTTLTIPAGAASTTLSVAALTDTVSPEPNETVVVTLTPGTGYTVGAAAASTVTITDVPPGALPTVTLSPATVSVAEGASTTLTVNRTGATTAPLTVRYSVGGTATSGSDFTALSGTLTIPAGQPSAAITVAALTDAVSPEPNETVVVTLTADPAYTVGAAGVSTVTITDVPPGTPGNNQQYVNSLYQTLLQRSSDAAGLAFWTSQLNQGVARSQVAQSFVLGTEYRTIQVRQLYRSLLRREADAPGLASWVALLGRPGRSIDDVQAGILGSDEYFRSQAGRNDDRYLDVLYRDTLRRALDPAGREFWGDQLDDESRQDVGLGVLRSREARTLLVRDYYQQFLGRPADQAGLTSFVNALTTGLTPERAVIGIVASDEFFARATRTTA